MDFSFRNGKSACINDIVISRYITRNQPQATNMTDNDTQNPQRPRRGRPPKERPATSAERLEKHRARAAREQAQTMILIATMERALSDDIRARLSSHRAFGPILEKARQTVAALTKL